MGSDSIYFGTSEMRVPELMSLTRLTVCMILIGIALLWNPLAFSQQPSADACERTLLPEPARKLLERKFPSWRIRTVNDLPADEQEAWRKIRGESACPGIAVGHFEAEDRDTYAVVLVPKSNNKPIYRLIVINKGRTSFAMKVLEAPNREVPVPEIYKLPPGDYDYLESDETKRIHLTRDSFQVEIFERAAWLYYWKNGKYHSLAVTE